MVEIKNQKEKTAIEVGERIRYFRLKCNFSQEALALRIGMNPSYIGHLERGLKCPTIDTLCRITDSMGISLQEFFACEEEADIDRDDITRIQRVLNRIPPKKKEEFIKIIEEMAKICCENQY